MAESVSNTLATLLLLLLSIISYIQYTLLGTAHTRTPAISLYDYTD